MSERRPSRLARGVALGGGLSALALPVAAIFGFLSDAADARALRADGTVSGAVDGVADGLSSACALTVLAPFALIVIVAAGVAIVDAWGSLRGRAAGSLAVFFGGLTLLSLFGLIAPALADANDGPPPEAFVIVAYMALVSGVNLQAWRLARAA